MKKVAQRWAILGLLAIFFVVLAISIGLVFILICLFFPTPHVVEVIEAMDRFIASTLGWPGKYKVSSECARSTTLGARILRSLLDAIQRGHCEDAARGEGLINETTPG